MKNKNCYFFWRNFEIYKNNDYKQKYDYSEYYVNYLINDKVLKKLKF